MTESPIVYKFGGTSMGDAARIRAAAELIRAADARVAVVVSAMSGVTNELVRLSKQVTRGAFDADAVDAIRTRHVKAAADLRIDVATDIDAITREIADLLHAGAALGGMAPRLNDRLLACGEKLSTRLLAATLTADGRGLSEPVDADMFLETDGAFGSATPLFGVYHLGVRSALLPRLAKGVTPVITGFCGRAPCGSTTTLGRGGSDYSATLVGAAIDAAEVVIWTDVPGVFTANPTIVPAARVIPELNYREAAELAYYGAKVLHPRTIQPLVERGIPVSIKDSFNPTDPGTIVGGRVALGEHPVKGVSAASGQALVSIEGRGMAGVPGVAAKIFSTLASADISVTMISQASSESSVSFAVPDDRAADAEMALRRAFRMELAHADIEDVSVQPNLALVAVVGLGMKHAPGVSGRLFGALAHAGVNVVAIAQGSSELNITLAVDEADSARAIQAIHDAFALGGEGASTTTPAPDNIDIVLMGCGQIGRAFVPMLLDRVEDIANRYGARPRIVGLCDRSGYQHNAAGFDPVRLASMLASKADGVKLADQPGAVANADPRDLIATAFSGRRPAILVDVADGDSTDAYLAAIASGADIATANKVALAGEPSRYTALASAAAESRRVIRGESTVGAGLPILDTIEQLIATGDRVTRLEGCLSGTLTYVYAALADGVPLARVVTDATERGYMEPDPWVDLSGGDVLRKAIILSRVCGFDIDPANIHRVGLVGDELRGLEKPAFFAGLAPISEQLDREVATARENGTVLRYIATIEPHSITVGPQAVDEASRIGALRGTDNLLLVHSDRYNANSLAIGGPGAGAAVTAMGVLSDVIRIIAERAHA